jgi:uncharacterized membrane protein
MGAETMEPPTAKPQEPVPPSHLNEFGALSALIKAVRTRIIGGLLLALPIVLTFWIVYWLYTMIKEVVLDPMTRVTRYALGAVGVRVEAVWWDRVAIPILTVVLVLSLLYFLGLFVRSWVRNVVDRVLMHVPVVDTIYKGLSNVFQSLGDQMQGPRFKRVVLVEFPHPGMRALAFVTNSLRDATTDRKILCVCVLTGVVPPAGFTLFVPEESVIDIDWPVNQTLQAILSGGITAPAAIHYFEGLHMPKVVDPLIASHGHPIDPPREPRSPDSPQP